MELQYLFRQTETPARGIFAELDEFVTPENVKELRVRLESHGHLPEFHIFPGVNHAFFNDSRPDVYNAVVAQKAWSLVTDFFSKNVI